MNEEEIFHEALARGQPHERAAYLDQACADKPALRVSVEALLRANVGATGFLDQPPQANAANEQSIAECPGTVIGPYKLLEQIGEGGFGVVFMAEQTQPVRRKVALKVVKPGMDTRQVIARFEAERQALALMDHPNIAHIFDGGETASARPYFVMELVRGIPITEFCDQNHSSVRERLELFVSVCQAVQHAHQKGIIHRDLKPTNILVTMHDSEPLAKVIDFGIAKATGQQLTEKTLFTNFAQMIGTPMYMSPEQAQMSAVDVDTRSDIYSLGVLLYELLTGTTPFDKERLRTAAYDEIRRIIREEEPAKPSTRMSTLGQASATASANRQSDPKRLSNLFRGELDWIVMKALDKDRNRRYETANGLAHDVERYLRDEPVLACPPSAEYRLRKFVRRNKGPVFVVSILLLVFIGGFVGTMWQAIRAQQARESADRNASDARQAENIAEAERARAQENLKLALQALDETFVFIHRRDRAGPLHTQLTPDDRKFLERGLAFYQRFAQSNSTDPLLQREAAKAYWRVGWMHTVLGQYANAEAAYRKGIPLLERLTEEFPTEYDYRSQFLSCHYWLGCVLKHTGRRQEAEAQLRHAIVLCQEMVLAFPSEGEHSSHLRLSHDQLRRHFQETGRSQQVDQLDREELAFWEKWAKLPADAATRIWDRANLAYNHFRRADLLVAHGQPHEAEEAYRKGLDDFDKLIVDFADVPEHRHSLAGHCNSPAWRLATHPDLKFRDPARAVRLAKRAVELAPNEGTHWNTLGAAHYRAGDWKSAVAALEKSMELPPEEEASDCFFLAMAHWRLGDKEQARKRYEQALRWMDKNKPQDEELLRFRAEAEALIMTTDEKQSESKK